jgi:hypothetical protein
MKKIIACCVLMLSFMTQATVMKVELDKTEYKVGDNIFAQLRIQDYTGGVSAFGVDLRYMLSGLTLENISFSGALMTSIQDFSFSGDLISLLEVNTDVNEDLAAFQSANFVVATLNFKALLAGSFSFDLLNPDLGDINGTAITPVELQNANFKVVSAPAVPAPATALLLLPALLLLKRRRA